MSTVPDDSLQSLFLQVTRLHHRLLHARLGALGLFRGQPPILHLLREQDGCSQREIAERFHLQPATVTDTLQRMEKAGLLHRRPDLADLRVSRVYLTDKGRETILEADRVLAATAEECFAGFTPEERASLLRLLKQMQQNLMPIADSRCPECGAGQE